MKRVDISKVNVGDKLWIKAVIQHGWGINCFYYHKPIIVKRLTPKRTKLVDVLGVNYDTNRQTFYIPESEEDYQQLQSDLNKLILINKARTSLDFRALKIDMVKFCQLPNDVLADLVDCITEIKNLCQEEEN